jgi:hypothetical protein
VRRTKRRSQSIRHIPVAWEGLGEPHRKKKQKKKKDKKKLAPVIWIPRFPHLIKWDDFFLHDSTPYPGIFLEREKREK